MAVELFTQSELKKLEYGTFALVEWLLEGTLRFATTQRQLRKYGLSLWEINTEPGDRKFVKHVGDGTYHGASNDKERAPALIDRLGGDLDIAYEPLWNRKIITGNWSHTKNDKGPNAFWRFFDTVGETLFSREAYDVALIRCTDNTLEWWNAQGREYFEALKEKRYSDRAKVARTVLIGSRCTIRAEIPPQIAERLPQGFRHPMPDTTVVRPTWTATVVKETATRLYVTDVVRVREERKALAWSREPDTIRGRAPNHYVDRADVIADHADTALVNKLVHIDADAAETVVTAAEQALREMVPILLNMFNRTFQNEVSRDEMTKEAIAQHQARLVAASETPTPSKPRR
jgi:hypothetical protein